MGPPRTQPPSTTHQKDRRRTFRTEKLWGVMQRRRKRTRQPCTLLSMCEAMGGIHPTPVWLTGWPNYSTRSVAILACQCAVTRNKCSNPSEVWFCGSLGAEEKKLGIGVSNCTEQRISQGSCRNELAGVGTDASRGYFDTHKKVQEMQNQQSQSRRRRPQLGPAL